MRILLLGGTTEASAMAQALAAKGIDAVFSYAGRTASPIAQPLPTRVGGFGGVAGFQDMLIRDQITHVIDATHPFAAGMSRNAHAVCSALALPLVRLARAPWSAGPGDAWTHVPDLAAAARALPADPARVFLAIGKQQLALFASQPQHHYLLRLVDPPQAPLPLPQTTVVLAKGPFNAAGDTALLRAHAITHIIAKNAGGSGAEAKLIAARTLGLPVILADRPALPAAPTVSTVAEAMAWLSHQADRGV